MRYKKKEAEYAEVLRHLQPKTLYTPGMIATMITDDPLAQRRLISTLSALRRRNLPAAGDGEVRLVGKRGRSAWLGWRWRLLLRYYRKRR